MPNQTTQALEALREAMEAYGAGDSAVVMALCVQRAIIALESAAPSAALKDHEVREVISAVTKVVQQYGQTQQLRERIKDVLFPVLKAALSSAAPSAAEPVAIQDGWKLVPIEPTRDMLEVCKISFINSHGRAPWERNRRAFRAMVAAAPPAPQSASELEVTQAARDVLAERQRQISAEGYTPEHDDEHGAEEFGRAASVYANSHVYDVIGASYMGWPWDEAWYKPTTQRRDFVKAAALLLAGIECIDRAAGIAAPPAPQAASEPASVAGLSGDAEREALTDDALAGDVRCHRAGPSQLSLHQHR